MEMVYDGFAWKAVFSIQRLIESEEEWEMTWGTKGYGINNVAKTDMSALPAEANQNVAQVSLSANRQVFPNREEKLEMRSEELEIEKEKTNRFWLYLAILPLILAILYLMRRKKE